MAGLVGGLVFAALLYVSAAMAPEGLENQGLIPYLYSVLATDSTALVYAAHLAMSVLFGLLFALVVSPRFVRASLVWGLVYGAILWLLAGFLALRVIAQAPLALDAEAAYNLVGHLIYGITLGAVYAWFARLEVYEALTSDSPRWRAWGARIGERRR